MAEAVTLHAVADRAGVSIASVSRVLNGLPTRGDTADRVHTAVTELKYQPNAMARSLRAGRTMQIALAVADVANPVYAGMMREVEQVLSTEGYRLMMMSGAGDAASTRALIDDARPGLVDGLIIAPLRVDDGVVAALRGSRTPTVVIGALPDGERVDTVRADSATGVSLAVDAIVAQGRRRIGFVNGPADTLPGRRRAAGFSDSVARHGLKAATFEADDFTFEAARDAMPALRLALAAGELDAVVAANDLLAAAVLRTAAEANIRVPDELVVVGMDDTSLAELLTPSLASVNLGSAERARRAAELLLDRIDDPALDARHIVIAPRLVVRASLHPDPEEGTA